MSDNDDSDNYDDSDHYDDHIDHSYGGRLRGKKRWVFYVLLTIVFLFIYKIQGDESFSFENYLSELTAYFETIFWV